MSESRF